MSRIDTGRVVTGGLVAGVVMNICDFVWNFTVMSSDMAAMAQKFGLDPAAMESFSAAMPFIIADFVLGFVVVWTYAAMRPRFGPGPMTALLAAIPAFLGIMAIMYGFTAAMNLMPMATFVKGTVTSVVTMALGSLAGAWLYRES